MSTPGPSMSGVSRLEKADSVIKAWTRFNGVYKAKRYIIENRWMRLKSDRKKKALEDAWPGMPENHRPDLDGPAAWRRKGQKALVLPWPPVAAPEELHLRMPHFNKEDLGDSSVTLLQVLESRANGQPGDFGRLDADCDFNNRRLRDYYRLRSPIPFHWDESLKGTYVAFAGQVAENNRKEYGAMCEIEGQEHFEILKLSSYLSIKDGNRAMDSQERIYNFLERICRMLTDESKNKTFAVKGEKNQTDWKRRPIFDPQGPEETESLRLYLDDCKKLVDYTTPFEIDWDFASLLSGSLLHKAQQRLRDLKEDPEAFFLSLEDTRNHSTEVLLYPGAQRHPWKNVDDNPVAWSLAFKELFSSVCWSIDFWQNVFTHIEKLRQIVQSSPLTSHEIASGSEEYRSHILATIANLMYVMQEMPRFITRLNCSEGLRAFYRADENGQIYLDRGARGPSNDQERGLVALLNALRHDHADLIYNPFTLASEIRRRVERPWLSDYVMDFLEEIEDGRLLLTHIYRAWDSERHFVTGDDLPDSNTYPRWVVLLRAIDADMYSPLERVFHTIMMTTDSNGNQKVGSLRRKFLHTKKKKMSKAERTKSIEAEANLAAFWKAAEGIFQEPKVISPDVEDILADVEPLATSPVAPTASSSKAGKAAPAQPSGAFVPLPAAQPGDLVAKRVPRTLIDLQAEARKRIIPVALKDQGGPADAPEAEEGAVWPKIVLGLDEYSTIDHLMGKMNIARPGEIDWDDIVRLLGAIGFEGPRMHAGSARSFAPGEDLRRNQGITQTIGVHEPHQGGKMPLLVARDWARHRAHGLAKYGWDIDHFIQDGDEVDQAETVFD